MDLNGFTVRGKTVQMARKLKGVSSKDFAKRIGVHHVTLCTIENETRSISTLNEIRILRGLRDIGVSQEQIWAIQMIVIHDEGGFEE